MGLKYTGVRITGALKQKDVFVSAAPPTTPITDLFFNNVTLLIQPLAQDSSVVDLSNNNNILTNTNVNLVQDTNRISGKSLDFSSNSITSVLTQSPSNIINFETGDFTFEFWSYVTVRDTDGYNFVLDTPTTANRLAIARLGAGPIGDGSMGASNSSVFLLSNNSYPINEWFHTAITRSSGTLALFIDGVLVDSTTYTQNLTSSALSIGNLISAANAGNNYKGLIDNLRITSGVARYTTNFTPEATFLTQ